MVRILIVDDSTLVRHRLRDLLQRHPDWDVCGEAASGQDAVERVQELSPDVIVLDFLMPGMDGRPVKWESRGRLPSPTLHV